MDGGPFFELDLFLPDTCWSEQPHFTAQVGKRLLKIVPDPGATTSWVLTDGLVEEQRKIADSGWSEIHGFDQESDAVAFTYLDLPKTDVLHDGFRGKARWITEQFSISNFVIKDFKLRLLQTFEPSHPGAFLNYEGLLGLGMSKDHLVQSNWLLRACLEGMKPVFAFQCGLPFQNIPKIRFGSPLPETQGFVNRYYQVKAYSEDVQGSHWFLRVKAIKWKCKGVDQENILDKINFTYQAAWKNSKPDKIFEGRAWSWAWFDMGYPTIVLPSTYAFSDTTQIQKLMADLKAGNLGVVAGTVALDVIPEEIKLERISFVFEHCCGPDGKLLADAKDEEWTFGLEDLFKPDGSRRFEIEIENKNVDRKCIIIGLPFAKKYSLEYHFDPSVYSKECQDIHGFEMLGFQKPTKQ